jgi:hypothetical protein
MLKKLFCLLCISYMLYKSNIMYFEYTGKENLFCLLCILLRSKLDVSLKSTRTNLNLDRSLNVWSLEARNQTLIDTKWISQELKKMNYIDI